MAEKISVTLPELPKEKELEEYVSAIMQNSGFYIERNIIEREKGHEILELDIAITLYKENMAPNTIIVEVKSGDWGFGDLFKLRGWMDFLGFKKGIFIVSKPRDNFDFIREKVKLLNIDLYQIPDLSKSAEILKNIIISEKINPTDIAIWRFSYWTERKLISILKKEKTNNLKMESFRSLDEYYYRVNSNIFFSNTTLEKLLALYETFQKFPYVSAKCGNEIIGNSFSEEYSRLPDKVFSDTYYNCSYTPIQISTFIEHKARLAILKNGIDYILQKNISSVEKNLSGLAFGNLPLGFRKGLEIIGKHKEFDKYPVFWQWFLWVFGGFILKDYEEQEYELFANKTGISIEEIPNALKAYEILFPHEGGWFTDLANSNIKVLKMFSVPFMGVGVHYRINLYSEKGSFDDLKFTGTYTRSDMVKCNNLMVEILKTK